MTDKIRQFIESDNRKLEELIEKYPEKIPVKEAAALLDCHTTTLQTALESGKLGFSERKLGKVNRAFVIPTAHFVRWYVCEWGV